MKRCNERCLALLGLLMLAGCAGAPPAPTPAPEPAASAPAERPAVPSAAQTHYDVALDLMRRERYQEAAVALTAMTRNYPDLIGPYLNLAIAQERGGRGEDAELTLRAALERHPASALAYNQLGLLYRERGRFEEARRAYEQALAIDSDYADARLNLAILYDLYLQQPRMALAHYELYRRAGGDDPMVERWLADLRQRLGQPAQAAQPAAGVTP